jgi:hypothetical protein
MDTGTFRELLTPTGQTALVAAAEMRPTEVTFLGCFEKLRRKFAQPLARAALEMVLLRIRAREKFSAADRMYFTREALEQASGEVIAQYRAQRFCSYGEVADLCCGIGGDTLALARAGLTVQAVEHDALRVAMANANAEALVLVERIRIHEADALTVPLSGVRSAFADPSRRTDGIRKLNPEYYTPPLSALRNRFIAEFPLGVKIAPGVALNDVAGLGAEVEFISVDGELKECVLWLGSLKSAARRATVLPTGNTLFANELLEPLPLASVSEYIHDPDPAVVRAGLATQLATQLGLQPLDHMVALFTSHAPKPSPFLTAYRVEVASRFHLQRLRDHFRQHNVGRVTIVKRGSRLDAGDVLRKLKLDGEQHRTVLLTQVGGEQTMIVAEVVR